MTPPPPSPPVADAPGPPGEPADGTPRLARTLRQRHVTLIALGGMIGGAFFVGSSAVIANAGPASLLTYAISGAIIVLVMRALGEMAAARPHSGSFLVFPQQAFGPWAGFTVGWVYWYFWAVVLGFEAVAGANIAHEWLPGIPMWGWAAIFLGSLTATNLLSVKSFGEFEFWFASVKIAALFVFFLLVIATLLGLDLGGDGGASVGGIVDHGGFLPNGATPVVTMIATAIFMMQGGEIATIAAAESDAPGRAIARATQLLVVRQTLLFLVSVFLILCAVPWSGITVGVSPFASALDALGIPAAATVMNAVVLVAILSALNSGIYITSRTLFSLAAQGQAPRWMLATTKRGVPARATLTASVVGAVCVVGAVVSPDDIFSFLLNSSAATNLFVYAMIAAAELKIRPVLERTDPDALRVRMWGFPYLTWVAIAAMVGVIALMATQADMRPQLLPSFGSIAVILVAYRLTRAARARSSADPGGGPADPVA
ncbi:amino acid permease, partial [Patulibacter sp. S7RM1-6]